MATGRRKITACGVHFDVEFWASKGRPGTYWEPPELAELIIEAVFIGDQEVTEILPEEVKAQLLDVLDQELVDSAYAAKEEALIADAEYRKYAEEV